MLRSSMGRRRCFLSLGYNLWIFSHFITFVRSPRVSLLLLRTRSDVRGSRPASGCALIKLFIHCVWNFGGSKTNSRSSSVALCSESVIKGKPEHNDCRQAKRAKRMCAHTLHNDLLKKEFQAAHCVSTCLSIHLCFFVKFNNSLILSVF